MLLPDPGGLSTSSTLTAEKVWWYDRTDFEGISYLSSLSSSPIGDGRPSLAFNVGRAPECLLVAENHLGITDLRLADFPASDYVHETPGTWWRTIPLDRTGMKVDVETDGIKLRRLVCGDRDVVTWSVPEPRTPRFHHFTHDSSHRAPARMASFLCNHPKATGYSFLWDCGLVHIHSHTADEDTAFYQSIRPGSWLHMPVDHGELITQIWQQRSPYSREQSIAFVTNTGRVFVAGVYRRTNQSPFALIERPGPKLSRIYFQTSDDGIGSLAFATAAPKHEYVFFHQPQPSSNNIFLSIDNYFFTSHSLHQLEEITPCLASGGTAVTGLLLHFPGGHRGSVGKTRLDRLGDRFSVTEAPLWFLTFGKRPGGYPYVLEVGTCRPDKDGDFQHMQLSRAGKLEWIWSERQCLVICNGHRSPPTT
ncbi:hypothetical protein DCS_05607 [Drechmeria coniospora]|uniref:Uncharacterized protein n=1 Tax=Drechmeria coniospora TaxID=98403 RepID=A0A151GNC1_DRECN|nr:hypothetical protein DCS_05607 [Drechmeria coniospora]KYK58590.1 hypothetical protein DCS_05607 [Drechmeria coniospora]